MQWDGWGNKLRILVTLPCVHSGWQHQIWAATRQFVCNADYTRARNRAELVLCVMGALSRYPKWGGTCPTDNGLRFATRSCCVPCITMAHAHCVVCRAIMLCVQRRKPGDNHAYCTAMHQPKSVPCNGVAGRRRFTFCSHFVASILGGSTRFGLQ